MKITISGFPDNVVRYLQEHIEHFRQGFRFPISVEIVHGHAAEPHFTIELEGDEEAYHVADLHDDLDATCRRHSRLLRDARTCRTLSTIFKQPEPATSVHVLPTESHPQVET